LARFVFFALPLLLLVLGATAFAAEAIGATAPGLPAPASLWREPVSGRLLLSTWVLEALGLVVLFLLVQSRGEGSVAADGLATAGIAWLFRGPVLVLTAAAVTRLGREPWWTLSLQRLAAYLVSGLVLALLARHVGLRR
jgi:hypothetical protein